MPRHIAIFVLVVVIALALPGVGRALTLGELEMGSAIGEPLRARIPFVADPGEVVGPACVSLVKPPPEADPRAEYLVRAYLEFPRGTGAILLSSHFRHHQPVLRVRLLVTCGGMNLVRDFTALLDPPVARPSASPPAARRAITVQTAPPSPAPLVPASKPPATKDTSLAGVSAPPAAAGVASSEESPALVLECERAAQNAQQHLDRCLTLRAKVEELEGEVKALQGSLQPKPPVSPAKVKVEAPEAVSALSLQDWMMIVAALLVAFIGILTLKRRRQSPAEVSAAPSAQALPPWLEKERRSGRGYAESEAPETPLSPKAETASNVDTLLLEARRLMVHDRALSAIKLLDDYIHANPVEPRPWMMRFVLLGARQMTREFAIAARQFREQNPEPELWDNVCALGREVDPGNPLYNRPGAPDRPGTKPGEDAAKDQPGTASAPDQGAADFRHPLDFSWLPGRSVKRDGGEDEKP